MPLPIAPLALGAGLVALLALGGKSSSSSAPAGHPSGPGAPSVPGLDPNMPPDVAHAVQVALATETDPAKLRAFAASLLPEYPLAAAALNAKAAAIDAAHGNLPAHPNMPPLPPPPPFQPPAVPPGIVPPGVVLPLSFPLPPPGSVPFPAPGSQAVVNTTDQGPSGQLAIRQIPQMDGAIVGWSPHLSLVTITGPGQNGFLPVTGPGGTGWSSASFLADPASGASAAAATPGALVMPPITVPGFPTSIPEAVPAGFGVPSAGDAYIVNTQTDPLNVRMAPDQNSPVVGANPKGAVVTVLGPAVNGFYPVTSPGGDGFSSAQYLIPQGTSVSAGFVPGAVPILGRPAMMHAPPPPFLDLEGSAITLQDALRACGCRSYNEPKVKDFQRAATRAGIYQGPIDGFYGTTVQGALAKVVGAPAPPCFPEPKGGPFNPNEYWSPIGT